MCRPKSLSFVISDDCFLQEPSRPNLHWSNTDWMIVLMWHHQKCHESATWQFRTLTYSTLHLAWSCITALGPKDSLEFYVKKSTTLWAQYFCCLNPPVANMSCSRIVCKPLTDMPDTTCNWSVFLPNLRLSRQNVWQGAVCILNTQKAYFSQ